MRTCQILALAALLGLGAADSARADVQIAMWDGRVTLNATGATVREILAAWAKAGQTTILNAERISGAPINLQLLDVPEEQALEIILRSVSGYLAAPRATTIANASRFDRIFVMPTSTPPLTLPAPQPAFPQPAFNPAVQPPPAFPRPSLNPAVQPLQPAPDDDDEPAPGGVQNPRGPLFTFPPPGMAPPGGTPAPAVTPANGRAPGQGSVGVAIPGMIVQPPQQPGPGPSAAPPPQQEP